MTAQKDWSSSISARSHPERKKISPGSSATNALPAMLTAGARIDALFMTERRSNGFPRLPVREGEAVFVWFECHPDQNAAAAYQNRLRQNPIWTTEIYPRVDSQCWRRIDVAHLTPTSRSLCGS
jgi:hypothetical protein